jgi:hypothetical protein
VSPPLAGIARIFRHRSLTMDISTYHIVADFIFIIIVGFIITTMALKIVRLMRENTYLREKLKNRDDWGSFKKMVRKTTQEGTIVDGHVLNRVIG